MSAVLRRVVLWILVCVIVVILAEAILGFLARLLTVVLLAGLVVLVLSIGRRSGADD
jgi:hypothetical protein